MFGSPPRLGRVQLTIMQTLWARGSATAREITDALSTKNEIAHSTVQTLLRKLEAKGAVTHTLEDRTFVFRPVYRQNEVSESALDDLLHRVFHGSVYGMVAQLIAHEDISSDELARLRKLIDAASSRQADVDAESTAKRVGEEGGDGPSC